MKDACEEARSEPQPVHPDHGLDHIEDSFSMIWNEDPYKLEQNGDLCEKNNRWIERFFTDAPLDENSISLPDKPNERIKQGSLPLRSVLDLLAEHSTDEPQHRTYKQGGQRRHRRRILPRDPVSRSRYKVKTSWHIPKQDRSYLSPK